MTDQLPIPDYYLLEEAAKKLKCSKQKIIGMGASGQLPIYILTAKFLIVARTRREEGMVSHLPNPWRKLTHSPITRIARLSSECLAELEAGIKHAIPIIEPQDMQLLYELKHKYKPIPNFEAIKQARSLGIDTEKHEYIPHITLADCVMVVLAKDLPNKGADKEGADKKRANHVKDWVKRTDYKRGKTDGQIWTALKAEKPGIWGETFESGTFQKWLQTPEGKEVAHLLPNKYRKN